MTLAGRLQVSAIAPIGALPMKKSIRNLVLLSILSFAAVPMMRADMMGTNPRPQRSAISFFSFFGW
jgi:hypothetical protein